jgi:hypothetical protein
MSNKEDELSRLKSQTLIIRNAYQDEKKKSDLKDDQIKCLRNEIKELNNQNVALNKRINELIRSSKIKNNDSNDTVNKLKYVFTFFYNNNLVITYGKLIILYHFLSI